MNDQADRDVEAISRIEAIDTILRVISESTGMRLSLVARVTDDDWKACAVHDAMSFGLSVGDHLDVTTTLCSEVRDTRAAVVIEHASEEPAWREHRTPKLYKFESYVAVPIFLADGGYFGNVCALDANPLPVRKLNAESMMSQFAKLVGFALDDQAYGRRAEQALEEEKRSGLEREQFIGVLAHDLRTPLSAVVTGTEMLLASGLDDRQTKIARRVVSSGMRMARLVDDVLDFARGRLGGGIALRTEDIGDLHVLVQRAVDEVAMAHPTRAFDTRLADVGVVRVDPVRIGQLIANLLANAIEHGTEGSPIGVTLEKVGPQIRLAVSNMGDPIPPEQIPRLFDSYVRRAESTGPRSGLGLGLFIVAQIARAHGGTVVASSDQRGTEFSCLLPRGA